MRDERFDLGFAERRGRKGRQRVTFSFAGRRAVYKPDSEKQRSTQMSATWTLDPAHPALAGHFPEHPVAPGVVVIDQIVAAVEAQAAGLLCVGVRRMKFLRPLRPGETFALETDAPRAGNVRIRATVDGELLLEGQLVLADRLTGGG